MGVFDPLTCLCLLGQRHQPSAPEDREQVGDFDPALTPTRFPTPLVASIPGHYIATRGLMDMRTTSGGIHDHRWELAVFICLIAAARVVPGSSRTSWLGPAALLGRLLGDVSCL